MGKETTDFRYNTGATKVPWAAVGENYNAEDLMAIIKFLMQGEGEEYDNAIAAIWENVKRLDKISTPPGKLSTGNEVAKVEAKIDEFLGSTNATFVTNATAGFEIAYKYANLQPGDEVIVPAITFVATMAYPLAVGAKLVFADVDPRTVNMDPADVARKITPKTKMIVPVHMGGYPVDMDPIMELAKKHDILVLEDCAHAFGAMYKGKKLGTIGDFAAFSLHEVKNITSLGEGGIVTTTRPDFINDIKRSRFFGLDFATTPIKDWLYNVTPMPGKEKPFMALNYSPTEIQALGLSLQFDRLDKIIAERKAAAENLTKRFSECDAIIPQQLDDDTVNPSYHLYLVQIDPAKAGGDVQTLKKKLTEKGVTEIAHFGPLYRFKVVEEMGYNPDEIAATCPVCEEVFYKRYTHLPLYGLDEEQLKFMADAVISSVEEMQRGE